MSEKPVRYPKTYPKIVSDVRRNLFGYENLLCTLFVCRNNMFRISQVNVSDITFRISEKLFEFVMTLRGDVTPLKCFEGTLQVA